MFNMGWTEIILILGVALVVFGPGKLPEIAETMGKTFREFKKAVNSMDADIKNEVNDVKATVEDVKDTVNVKGVMQDLTDTTNAVKEEVEQSVAQDVAKK